MDDDDDDTAGWKLTGKLPSPLLRPATAADAASMAALHAACLPNDPAALLGSQFLATRLYPQLLAQARCALVAVVDEAEVVGFVIFGKPVEIMAVVGVREVLQVALSPSSWHAAVEVLRILRHYPTDLPPVELQWIAVSSAFQGHGVGSSLVLEALRILATNGVAQVWVKTLSSTPGTVSFYQNLGFNEISTAAGRVFLEYRA